MKAAILAGGLGTRFSEETKGRPKALVEIGGRPIIWHVMRHYAHFGFSEFVLAGGYRKADLARYFTDYHRLEGSIAVDLRTGTTVRHDDGALDWLVHVIDTGEHTMTGGRVKRLAPFLGNETFMLTWCDGLADVDLAALLAFHRSHGRLATVTAVQPPGRFGHLTLDGDAVTGFEEKPERSGHWINGAFFVLEPGVFDYIEGDATMWEEEPMRRLATDGQLMAYRHDGFWQCMDTAKERDLLEKLWATGKAPWNLRP
ncbi:glucose-1-phosphate cytidylyltransferase [Azospirillum sp. RWY-5-1]|uniref:Glucose-1-phosphate cytidylyltransferase n=1 Tax=Azospirillum oleiclasticum TaxID=2735135 RepID=A0ABX2TKC6_9PROT|nr:glucose-1-phosphate cytidylyltransferase [Azospirillum oleiclasticum]NYZ23539.1 glucose-1-phosphate cytidylyltransferase [Azospirillum oleiclasticum]